MMAIFGLLLATMYIHLYKKLVGKKGRNGHTSIKGDLKIVHERIDDIHLIIGNMREDIGFIKAKVDKD